MSADSIYRGQRAEEGNLSDSINIERSLQCHVGSTQEKLLKVAQKYIKADELGPNEYNNQRKKERKKEHEIGRKNHFMTDS